MDTLTTLQAGRPWPLGAHWDGAGVNIAVFSAHAQAMEWCLFDDTGAHEQSRTFLPGHSHDIWHGYLPGAAPGLVYGLRAHGPWRPDRGHRFNPQLLVLDPYTREIVNPLRNDGPLPGQGADQPPHEPDPRDTAAWAPKARVVADGFDWDGDQPPHTPAADTVLYELHVKNFTRLHPQVPPALQGTYAGLASDAAISHLQHLGVTTVSLMPVHQWVDEPRLQRLGLRNHWGYNSVGYFCPEPRLAAARSGSGVRDEFRHMVKRLHQAGIEVVLDVVYNHSAEGDEWGPTLSFRGLDNASYYRLPPQHKSHYENLTGCGNTLDLRQPRVVQLVMDSLRHWAGDMHVDGFRFDLAPVLGRADHGFDRQAPLFAAIAQDPLLSRLKLIAEPWDPGPGGYQLGGFAPGWMEWNDRFRDAIRGFWVSGQVTPGEFAQRLCGSSDLLQPRHRSPAESVNFVVAHDGFTLDDLLSYNDRHNQANGEGNRDGHAHNLSWNCGVEGPTDDPTVTALRGRLARALLACTVLAQGTPMLAAGAELGHSQQGNNNAYCQDNAHSWLHWPNAAAPDRLVFTRHLMALRRWARPFGNRWYDGLRGPNGHHDVAWLRQDGEYLQGHDWHDVGHRVLGCLIGHPAAPAVPLLLLVNAEARDQHFSLPEGRWRVLLDSAEATGQRPPHEALQAGFELPARSVCLLAPHDAPLPPPHP